MKGDSTSATETDPDEAPSMQRLVWETVIFTVVVVAAVAGAGYLFRSPLQQMAQWMIATMGYVGLFAGVFLADAFTFPVPPDVYLFVSVASGANVVLTLVSCAAASVVAGNLAYVIGPYVERIPLLQDRLRDFRPRGEYLFARWGVRAVAVAALTPVPFSIVSWLAGIYDMQYRSFLFASFARIPRIVGYYLLYVYGWAPAAA